MVSIVVRYPGRFSSHVTVARIPCVGEKIELKPESAEAPAFVLEVEDVIHRVVDAACPAHTAAVVVVR